MNKRYSKSYSIRSIRHAGWQAGSIRPFDGLVAGILAISAIPSRQQRTAYIQYIRPGCLRVLWDNPLNEKKYADAIFLLRIARQVEGRNTGTTP